MHDHSGDFAVLFTREFWDDRYGSADQLWSGQPNSQLVAQLAGLPPGDALDVGSGEGADAIWLASQGWTVTAADISAVALERAAGHAARCGAEIAGRISWQQADLLSWDPGDQRYDLVSALFMYLPEAAIESLHRRLAAAVRPGGTLLIVLHHPDGHHPQARADSASPEHADGHHAHHPRADSASPPEDLVPARSHGGGLADTADGRALLALGAQPERLAATLDPSEFEILVAGPVSREVTGPDGQPATVIDTVLRAVRRA
jgi:SAM-dependent methyltransferase